MDAYKGNPRGRRAVDFSVAFTAVALFIVTLRLYTRFIIIRYAGLEDYIIILATISSVGFTICIAFQARWGVGQHIVDIAKDDMQRALKAFWVSVMVYYLNLGLTKASILLQYRRVFRTKKVERICWILLALNGVFTIWTIFGMIFACYPVRAFWTKEPAKCIDQNIMWFTNAAVHILGDLIIVILPMPLIRRLNLAKRQKRALMGIFALGGFVCLISIVRLQSLVAIANSTDPTYNNAAAATWSAVEINIGLICACLPLIRPLITKWFPTLLANNHNACTASRQIATIGSSSGRRGFRTMTGFEGDLADEDTDVIENEEKRIEVVTNIRVEVEGGNGRLSGWTTRLPAMDEEAEDCSSNGDASVKDLKEIV